MKFSITQLSYLFKHLSVTGLRSATSIRASFSACIVTDMKFFMIQYALCFSHFHPIGNGGFCATSSSLFYLGQVVLFYTMWYFWGFGFVHLVSLDLNFGCIHPSPSLLHLSTSLPAELTLVSTLKYK